MTVLDVQPNGCEVMVVDLVGDNEDKIEWINFDLIDPRDKDKIYQGATFHEITGYRTYLTGKDRMSCYIFSPNWRMRDETEGRR